MTSRAHQLGPAAAIRVFLSYARADAVWACRVEQALRARRYEVWRDLRDLRAGEDFTGQIERGVRWATHVVVCLTRDVQRRPDSFVRREIAYAAQRRDRSRRGRSGAVRPEIVPIVFPGGELPVHIATLTAVNVAGARGLDAGMQAVFTQIESGRPGAAPRPESALQRYLRDLHEEMSAALEESVQTLLLLEASDVPGAVAGSAAIAPRLRRLAVSRVLQAREAPAPTSPARHESLDDAFRRAGGRLLLLGEPGAGKTTSLLAFTRDAAVAALDDDGAPVPVPANVRAWDGRTPLRTWAMRSAGAPALAGRAALFLFDGLDELVAAGEEGASDQRRRDFLDRVGAELGADAVLLSSRAAEYRRLGRAAELRLAVTLLPLQPTQVDAYLQARGLARLGRTVAADERWRSLVRTPLLLALLSVAYGNDNDADAAAPDEATVFDRYVARRFVHERERGERLPFDEAETRRRLADYATRVIAFFMPRADRAGARDARFLRFAERMHLLRAVAGQQPEFIHLRLRDFFALPRLLQLERSADRALASAGYFMLVEQIGAAAWPLAERLARHADEDIRRRAIGVLVHAGTVAQVRPLLRAWRDGDKNLWWDVEPVLQRLARSHPQAFVEALGDDDERVRRNGVKLAPVVGRAGLPWIEPLLHGERAAARDAAIAWLGANAAALTAAEIERWLVPWLDRPEAELRVAAAAALAAAPGKAGIAPLMRLLDDTRDAVAVEAADTLVKRRHVRAAAALAPRLEDESLSALRRANFAHRLVELPGRRAQGAVLRFLRAGGGGELRPWIVGDLGHRADRAAARTFLLDALVHDPDPLVREQAAYALKAVADARAADALAGAAIGDRHPFVRDAAFGAAVASLPAIAAWLADTVVRVEPPDEPLAGTAAAWLVAAGGADAEAALRSQWRDGRAYTDLSDGERLASSLGERIERALEDRGDAWAQALLAALPWRR